jgi:hypothetical protein
MTSMTKLIASSLVVLAVGLAGVTLAQPAAPSQPGADPGALAPGCPRRPRAMLAPSAPRR